MQLNAPLTPALSPSDEERVERRRRCGEPLPGACRRDAGESALSPSAGERIPPIPTSRLEPLNQAADKVGQASRLPSERVSASMPDGFAAGGRRDACPTLRFTGRVRGSSVSIFAAQSG